MSLFGGCLFTHLFIRSFGLCFGEHSAFKIQAALSTIRTHAQKLIMGIVWVSGKGDRLDPMAVCPVKDLHRAATALPFSVFVPHSTPNFAGPQPLHFLETTPLSFHPAFVNGCDEVSFLLCPSWTAEMCSVSTRGCQGLQAYPAPAVLCFSCVTSAAN